MCLFGGIERSGKYLQLRVESATLRGETEMKRSRFTEEQIIGVLRATPC
jgi:hypothetical protein